MKKFADALARLLATSWAGGLWAIGYIAAPVLFAAQPDRMLAGMLAGKMFSAIALLGMAAGAYLLAYLAANSGKGALRLPVFWIVAAMLLLALIMQFYLQPAIAGLKAQVAPQDVMQSAVAVQFKMLHGVSSILYLVQSLLGAALVIKPVRT